MVDARGAVVQRMGQRRRRRRRYLVVAVVAGRASGPAARHPGVQPVRQRLLQRGHGGRGHRGLPVVQVRGRRRAARARHAARAAAASGRSGARRVRPTAVRGPAVESLERLVVARLGQQFQAHCRLPFPLGPIYTTDIPNTGLANDHVRAQHLLYRVNGIKTTKN